MKINGEFIVHPAPDELLALPEAELPRAVRVMWERGARADVPDFDRLVGAGQLARIREVPRVEEELERWLIRPAGSKGFDVAGCFLTGYWPGRQVPHAPLVRRLLDALDGASLEPAARNTVACALAKAHPATTDADLAARAAATFRRILQEEPLDAYSAGTLAWMRRAADAPP